MVSLQIMYWWFCSFYRIKMIAPGKTISEAALKEPKFMSLIGSEGNEKCNILVQDINSQVLHTNEFETQYSANHQWSMHYCEKCTI